jgi:NSS family neurotransmitter:Na+ symporter
MAGQNGGAAFVAVYIACVVLIGLPVMIAELSIGRNTEKNPVGAFQKLFPETRWKMVGGLGVISAVVGLSFYAVIAGYMLGYLFKILAGDFEHIAGGPQAEQVFLRFASSPLLSLGLLFVFVWLTALIVWKGVSQGIEKWSKFLMPCLFFMLIILAARALTLVGAGRGLEFYLRPDFSKITVTVVAQALGQALFSLSLGYGGMITYGSYVSKQQNLVAAAGSICFFDTLAAILAGFIIFPALFAMGMNPAAGPDLVFVVLPSVFAKMPAGLFFGAGFFLLVSLAALTTTIAVLEVPVAYFIDEKKWPRGKATLCASSIVFVIGVPSALSLGASKWLSRLPLLKIGFLDMLNIVFGNYSFTLGALFVSLFVGYKWTTRSAVSEIEQQGNVFRHKNVWAFCIRFICPAAIAVILAYIVVSGKYF